MRFTIQQSANGIIHISIPPREVAGIVNLMRWLSTYDGNPPETDEDAVAVFIDAAVDGHWEWAEGYITWKGGDPKAPAPSVR